MSFDREKSEIETDHKKLKIVIIILVVLLAVICIGAVYTAKRLQKMDTIFPNVEINGISVGGLTVEAAAAALEKSGVYDMSDRAVMVMLSEQYKTTIFATDCDLYVDIQEITRIAYNYGRLDGIVNTLLDYIRCKRKTVNFDVDRATSMNRDAVLKTLKPLSEEFSTETEASTRKIDIEAQTVTLIKGCSDVIIDLDNIVTAVENAFLNNEKSVDCMPMITYTDIALQSLQDMVYEAGYMETIKGKTVTITEVSFDTEAAQTAINTATDGTEIVLELTTTRREEKAYFDKKLLFRDLLGEKTTYMSPYNTNRNNNITRAAAAINELILYPGDEFSFNKVVGQRTAEAGYLAAGAYANGQVVNELGGGICQVSSTLYCAALYANLEITERYPHYFSVAYVPWGLDATVSWPNVDFKFINSRTYPIKILTEVDAATGVTSVKIYGTDFDGTYVEMTTDSWHGANNFGATSYRNVYDAEDNCISSNVEDYSIYHYHEEETEE